MLPASMLPVDPRLVYSQVFAHARGEQSIHDLLTVTRAGRLAVLELKSQRAHSSRARSRRYWLRIRRHLEQRDLNRYGYFP
jgi:hypothetical protein